MTKPSQPASCASRTFVLLPSPCPLFRYFSPDLFLWIRMTIRTSLLLLLASHFCWVVNGRQGRIQLSDNGGNCKCRCRIHALLGRVGGMSPRKSLKFRCSLLQSMALLGLTFRHCNDGFYVHYVKSPHFSCASFRICGLKEALDTFILQLTVPMTSRMLLLVV